MAIDPLHQKIYDILRSCGVNTFSSIDTFTRNVDVNSSGVIAETQNIDKNNNAITNSESTQTNNVILNKKSTQNINVVFNNEFAQNNNVAIANESIPNKSEENIVAKKDNKHIQNNVLVENIVKVTNQKNNSTTKYEEILEINDPNSKNINKIVNTKETIKKFDIKAYNPSNLIGHATPEGMLVLHGGSTFIDSVFINIIGPLLKLNNRDPSVNKCIDITIENFKNRRKEECFDDLKFINNEESPPDSILSQLTNFFSQTTLKRNNLLEEKIYWNNFSATILRLKKWMSTSIPKDVLSIASPVSRIHLGIHFKSICTYENLSNVYNTFFDDLLLEFPICFDDFIDDVYRFINKLGMGWPVCLRRMIDHHFDWYNKNIVKGVIFYMRNIEMARFKSIDHQIIQKDNGKAIYSNKYPINKSIDDQKIEKDSGKTTYSNKYPTNVDITKDSKKEDDVQSIERRSYIKENRGIDVNFTHRIMSFLNDIQHKLSTSILSRYIQYLDFYYEVERFYITINSIGVYKEKNLYFFYKNVRKICIEEYNNDNSVSKEEFAVNFESINNINHELSNDSLMSESSISISNLRDSFNEIKSNILWYHVRRYNASISMAYLHEDLINYSLFYDQTLNKRILLFDSIKKEIGDISRFQNIKLLHEIKDILSILFGSRIYNVVNVNKFYETININIKILENNCKDNENIYKYKKNDDVSNYKVEDNMDDLESDINEYEIVEYKIVDGNIKKFKGNDALIENPKKNDNDMVISDVLIDNFKNIDINVNSNYHDALVIEGNKLVLNKCNIEEKKYKDIYWSLFHSVSSFNYIIETVQYLKIFHSKIERMFYFLRYVIYLKWKYLLDNTHLDQFIKYVSIFERKVYDFVILSKKIRSNKMEKIFENELKKIYGIKDIKHYAGDIDEDINNGRDIFVFDKYYRHFSGEEKIYVDTILSTSLIDSLFQYLNLVEDILKGKGESFFVSYHKIDFDGNFFLYELDSFFLYTFSLVLEHSRSILSVNALCHYAKIESILEQFISIYLIAKEVLNRINIYSSIKNIYCDQTINKCMYEVSSRDKDGSGLNDDKETTSYLSVYDTNDENKDGSISNAYEETTIYSSLYEASNENKDVSILNNLTTINRIMDDTSSENDDCNILNDSRTNNSMHEAGSKNDYDGIFNDYSGVYKNLKDIEICIESFNRIISNNIPFFSFTLSFDYKIIYNKIIEKYIKLINDIYNCINIAYNKEDQIDNVYYNLVLYNYITNTQIKYIYDIVPRIEHHIIYFKRHCSLDNNKHTECNNKIMERIYDEGINEMNHKNRSFGSIGWDNNNTTKNNINYELRNNATFYCKTNNNAKFNDTLNSNIGIESKDDNIIYNTIGQKFRRSFESIKERTIIFYEMFTKKKSFKILKEEEMNILELSIDYKKEFASKKKNDEYILPYLKSFKKRVDEWIIKLKKINYIRKIIELEEIKPSFLKEYKEMNIESRIEFIKGILQYNTKKINMINIKEFKKFMTKYEKKKYNILIDKYHLFKDPSIKNIPILKDFINDPAFYLNQIENDKIEYEIDTYLKEIRNNIFKQTYNSYNKDLSGDNKNIETYFSKYENIKLLNKNEYKIKDLEEIFEKIVYINESISILSIIEESINEFFYSNNNLNLYFKNDKHVERFLRIQSQFKIKNLNMLNKNHIKDLNKQIESFINDLHNELNKYRMRIPRLFLINDKELLKGIVDRRYISVLLRKMYNINDIILKIEDGNTYITGIRNNNMFCLFDRSIEDISLIEKLMLFEYEIKNMLRKRIYNKLNKYTNAIDKKNNEIYKNAFYNKNNDIGIHSDVIHNKKNNDYNDINKGAEDEKNGTYGYVDEIYNDYMNNKSILYPHPAFDANNEMYIDSINPNKFGYEHHKETEMISTSITRKTFASFLLYLKNKCMGIVVHGRSGTGKTETVKYYSRKMGRKIYVFCCDEKTTCEKLEYIFKWCKKAGFYVCLDEFNRLDPLVMGSVVELIKNQINKTTCEDNIELVSNSLKYINISNNGLNIDSKSTNTNTLDNTIHIFPKSINSIIDQEYKILKENNDKREKMIVFLTMNIGYKGRSALPKSLKSNFGFVRIEEPDMEDIAKTYTKKYINEIIGFFKECDKVFENITTIDFGIRALKCILKKYNEIKNKIKKYHIKDKEDITENIDLNIKNNVKDKEDVINNINPSIKNNKDIIIIHNDNSINKDKANTMNLNMEDIDLSIYSNIDILIISICSFYIPSIQKEMVKRFDEILTKIFNRAIPSLIYRDLCIKNKDSLIVYGKRNTGKSTFIKKHFQHGKYYNPYTIDIFASIDFANDIRNKRTIIFDCKLESKWIENMNCAMDDNKLIYINDEMIDTTGCTFVFECDSIDNVTMATLTRVQIVYMEEKINVYCKCGICNDGFIKYNVIEDIKHFDLKKDRSIYYKDNFYDHINEKNNNLEINIHPAYKGNIDIDSRDNIDSNIHSIYNTDNNIDSGNNLDKGFSKYTANDTMDNLVSNNFDLVYTPQFIYYLKALDIYTLNERVIVIQGTGIRCLLKEFMRKKNKTYIFRYMDQINIKDISHRPLKRTIILTTQNEYETLREYINHGSIGRIEIKDHCFILINKTDKSYYIKELFRANYHVIELIEDFEIKYCIIEKIKIMINPSSEILEKIEKEPLKMLKKFVYYYTKKTHDIDIYIHFGISYIKMDIKDIIYILIKRKESFVLYGERLSGKNTILDNCIRKARENGILSDIKIIYEKMNDKIVYSIKDIFKKTDNQNIKHDLSNYKCNIEVSNVKLHNKSYYNIDNNGVDNKSNKRIDNSVYNIQNDRGNVSDECIADMGDDGIYNIKHDEGNISDVGVLSNKYKEEKNNDTFEEYQGNDNIEHKDVPFVFICEEYKEKDIYSIEILDKIKYKERDFIFFYKVISNLYKKYCDENEAFIKNGNKLLNNYLNTTNKRNIDITIKCKEIETLICENKEKLKIIVSEQIEIEKEMEEIKNTNKVLENELIIAEDKRKEVDSKLNDILQMINENYDNLKLINKMHLSEIKSMVKPPEIIKSIIECVYCILYYDKKDYRDNVEWDVLKSFIKKDDFIGNILNYKIIQNNTNAIDNRYSVPVNVIKDKNEYMSQDILNKSSNIGSSNVIKNKSEHKSLDILNESSNIGKDGKCLEYFDEYMLKRISIFFHNPIFNYEKANKASKACGPLFKWVESIYKYLQTEKEIKPLRKEIQEIQNKIRKQKNELKVKINKISILENDMKNKKNDYNANFEKLENDKKEKIDMEREIIMLKQVIDVVKNEMLKWIKSGEKEVDIVKYTCEMLGLEYNDIKNKNEFDNIYNNEVNFLSKNRNNISEDNEVGDINQIINRKDPNEFSNAHEKKLDDISNILAININNYGDEIDNICFIDNIRKLKFDSLSISIDDRLKFLLDTKRPIYIKSQPDKIPNIEGFMVTSLLKENFKSIAHNIKYYKTSTIIKDCDLFSKEVYSIIKHQMKCKSYNIILSSNYSNKYYINECYTLKMENDIKKELDEKIFKNIKIEEIKNIIKINESKLFESINNNNMKMIIQYKNNLEKYRKEYLEEIVVGNRMVYSRFVDCAVEIYIFLNKRFEKVHGFELCGSIFVEFVFGSIKMKIDDDREISCNKGICDNKESENKCICENKESEYALKNVEHKEEFKNEDKDCNNESKDDQSYKKKCQRFLHKSKDDQSNNNECIDDQSHNNDSKNNQKCVKEDKDTDLMYYEDDLKRKIMEFYITSFNKDQRKEIFKGYKKSNIIDEINSNNFDYVFITNNDENLNQLNVDKILYCGSKNDIIKDEMDKVVSKTNNNIDCIVKNIQFLEKYTKKGNQRFVYTIENENNGHKIMESCKIIYCDTMDEFIDILFGVKQNIYNIIKNNENKRYEFSLKDNNGINDCDSIDNIDGNSINNSNRNIDSNGLNNNKGNTNDSNSIESVENIDCNDIDNIDGNINDFEGNTVVCLYSFIDEFKSNPSDISKHFIIRFYSYLKYLSNFESLILQKEYEFNTNDLMCLISVGYNEIDYVVDCIIIEKLEKEDKKIVKNIYKTLKSNESINDAIKNNYYQALKFNYIHNSEERNKKIMLDEKGTKYKFCKCDLKNNNIISSEKDNFHKISFVNEKHDNESYIILINNQSIQKIYIDIEIQEYRFIIIKEELDK